MTRPVLVLCETCQSEGRILTSNGGPYEIDNGECPACKGSGTVLVEAEPITMEDLAPLKRGFDIMAHNRQKFGHLKKLAELEPRRCETSLVGGMGECLHCDADQGEACKAPHNAHSEKPGSPS